MYFTLFFGIIIVGTLVIFSLSNNKKHETKQEIEIDYQQPTEPENIEMSLDEWHNLNAGDIIACSGTSRSHPEREILWAEKNDDGNTTEIGLGKLRGKGTTSYNVSYRERFKLIEKNNG